MNDLRKKDSFDLLKFILSFMVVAIHTNLGIGRIYPLSRIAVPMFFMMSSYLLFFKVNSTDLEDEQKDILKRCIKRNMQLYLFWFIVLLPITIYRKTYFLRGGAEGFLSLLRDIFLGSTWATSWYIMASVIGVLVVYYGTKYLGRIVMLCISIVCYAVCCLASNYLFLIEQSEFGKIYLKIECWFGRPYNNFIIAIVWIMIGKYFAENIKNRNSGALALKLLASIALLVGEHIFIKERMGTAWNWNTDVYIMLLPASIFLFLLAEQSRMKIQGAENLRKISTIIYCSHWSIQAVLRVGFELLSIRDKWNVLLFLITSVSACIGGVIIMKLEKKWKVFKYAY